VVGVRRLITTVDLAEREPRPAHEASVSALHEAELTDGRRVVLLDDRGFTWAVRVATFGEHGDDAAHVPGAWETTTLSDLEENARTVVGPDEAYGDVTEAEMAAGHWETLAATLADHGVQVDPEQLSTLPHDVELTGRVLARIRRPRPS